MTSTQPATVDVTEMTRAQRAALPLSTEVAQAIAEQHGVCVRPLAMRRIDTATGRVDIVPVPCGSTREDQCRPCADKARRLRMVQCREGWHLDHEPVTDRAQPTDEQKELLAARADLVAAHADCRAAGDEDSCEQIAESVAELDAELRSLGVRGRLSPVDPPPKPVKRSTRRRQDAPDLPRRPVERRTVGWVFAGRYQPSTFLTLTLDSYGRVDADGAAVDPDRYDYRRAARDAVHFAALMDRFWQNTRRCVGWDVQYFGTVEPQKRGAPHFHAAIRGAIPRTELRAITAATYHQVWWPAHDRLVYTEGRLPVWDTRAKAFTDPDTGAPLPTWDEACADLTEPAHVVRFGAQVHVKGILGGTEEAGRHIGYLTKYLAKSVGQAAGLGEHATDRQRDHARRLQAELQITPCVTTERKRTHAPAGASSIYQDKDDKWHGRVTMGVRDDGKPDRRHVRGKNRAEVTKKVRQLERERDSGRVRSAGRVWTVEQWLTHWLDNIAAHSVRYKTLVGYRTDVTRHLVPGIGAHRINKLEPEHIEKLYSKMRTSGLAAGTVHHVHRTLRASLSEAVRRKHVAGNAAMTAKAPRVEEEEIEPLTVDEAKRLLLAASHRRNGTRWAVALSLGLRQGEALGLQWERVDLTTGTMRVREALQRRTWQHGCSDPHECGERYHKVAPCKTGCRRHQRTCPPPCPPGCTGHARWCPLRQHGGLVLDDVKSRAGRRTIALPPHLLTLLAEHQASQQRERDIAGDLWEEHEFVFTGPTGRPLDPRADNREWAELLKEAGVREARLHDARHTAATVLLVLGISQRAVMGLMGWSTNAMTTRYQHLTPDLRRDIAEQVGGLLWDAR